MSRAGELRRVSEAGGEAGEGERAGRLTGHIACADGLITFCMICCSFVVQKQEDREQISDVSFRSVSFRLVYLPIHIRFVSFSWQIVAFRFVFIIPTRHETNSDLFFVRLAGALVKVDL